ncbi:MAG: hypothetical protein ACP5I8_06575 [Phycisphaerae bacterium]
MLITDQTATPPIRDFWLRLGLAITPLAATVAAMVLALLVLKLLQRPLYLREMLAAALVSVVVGLLAVLPMVVLIGRSAILLLRCAVLANMTRLVGVALGAVLVIAFAPVQLHKTVLLLWLVAFYFVLLVAESMVSSWVIKHSKV